MEILDQRAPDRSVFANPGGTTTAEFSAAPTRVKQGNTWAAIDRTVIKRADGSLGPKATIGELRLSGGGKDAPLARLTKNGRSMTVFWPDSLPAPVLSGERATYPEVFPGVDLVMLAGVNGYQQHLVIKNAEAARNPALASIRLGVRTDGLTVSVDDRGAVHAVDEAGTELFTAPPSVSWDSAEHRAPVGLSLVDGSLVLAPDQKFLADPATAYPVTVDPNMVTFEKWGWATVLSGKPTDKYWWTSGEAPWAQVGQCWTGDGRCNGIGEAWAYFQFDTTMLWDKPVIGATLNTTVVHSPSCADRNHEIYHAGGGIWDGMTWNSRPGGWRIKTFTAPSVHSGCTGWKGSGGDIPVGEVTRNNHSAYFFKAENSGDQLAWRKYDPGATKLLVTYNRAPYVSEPFTDRPLPPPCRWCDGTPYVGDQNIRLIARLSDPDSDNVDSNWRVERDDVPVHTGWLGQFQASGSFHSYNLDLSNDHGKKIEWGVLAGDGYAASPDWHWGPGPFIVDRIGVTVEPTVSGALYKEDNRWHGGVNVPDTFTFGPSGVTDIDHYLYGWQDPPSPNSSVDANALGGSASVRLTPPGDGAQTLFVQSVDRAGHTSKSVPYHFFVRAGNGPLAQWSLEGNTDDTAFLGNRHGTLGGGATFGPGAVRSGISLDGVDDHISAPNTVRNDAAFTVSAWVNLTANNGARAVVSEDGALFPGFVLWYRADPNGANSKWVFSVPNSTTADKGFPMAASPIGMPALRTWTHLTGVYDPAAQQIRLYVNGSLVATAPHTAIPDFASGPVRIGRTVWGPNHPAVDHWPGGIDEVQIYDRVLTDAEIAASVSSSAVQVAHWKFDEKSGSTAQNSVEGGVDGVLEGGAQFTTDGAVNGGVELDGVDGTVTTPGPVVRTDQSFSVAAQVRLNRVDGGTYTVISQGGDWICGFCLQYQNQHWVFVFPRNDAEHPTGYDWVGTTDIPKEGEWTHLVGTYDAVAHKIRLYVNGSLIGETSANVAWSALGPMQIGRARTNGRYEANLPGTIDEVRVYSRAISEDEVRGIVSRDNVTAGTFKLDGNANDVNGKLNGTLNGGADWAAGQTSNPDPNDLAVRLNGTTGYISTKNAIDTDKSFSVTAWARLDKLGGNAAVVSQDGGTVSGFILKALPDNRWAFLTPTTDAVVSGDMVTSGAAAQAGVWNHLVGVYSKDRRTIELYVNGILAGSAPHNGGFDANGDLQIGRSKWNTKPADYLTGAIDDVSIYSRTLFANEIQVLAQRDVSLAHSWTMDEGRGTTVADAVGSRAGKLERGASFAAGRVSNAVHFDGVDDVVTTTGLDVRTDASFTLSSWVFLEGNDCDVKVEPRCMISAVSVDGGATSPTSKLRLGHVKDNAGHLGNWVFEMPEANGTISNAALAVGPDEVGKWVHLVGVYDAGTGTIWLYVNGVRKDDGTLRTPWPTTGGLRIGSGKVPNKPDRFWRGSVDDVRMYSGALTADRISALYKAYPLPDGPDTVLPQADAGHWRFDEGTGTSIADTSGRGLTATVKGGAGWIGGRSGWGTWLDGTSGYAETTGPVLDTAASFSVSAWAYLTNATRDATVVGQDGVQASAFSVQYLASAKKWAVAVPGATPPVVLMSAETAPVGDWVHLAVVYSTTTSQLRLYVNGAVSAVQVGVSVPSSAGPLSIGRAKRGGANAEFFPRGIDEVRAFRKALSDGEIRRVHDDMPAALHGHWRFDDGTARDYSWRQNATTVTGGATFPTGLIGKAMQLDGTGAATATLPGVSMRDSFTVSAWVKLSRLDKVATVASQDGGRQSGYVLQYRPEMNRWIFGAAERDEDYAPLVYANSLEPPTIGKWTHLTGIYDSPARQLRIYVDGQLVGSKNNVLLWVAAKGFVIGRSLVNGLPAEYFSGVLDDVTTEHGALAEAKLRQRAGWPAPSGGQLGRFNNDAGDHRTASAPGSIWTQFGSVPPGYRYEGTIGTVLSSEQPGTRRLYSCLDSGGDSFTSTDSACENGSLLGELGWIYESPPADRATVALNRCLVNGQRFDSIQANCENQTLDRTLGYVVAYAPIARYYHPLMVEHAMLTGGTPPGYHWEGTLGLVAMINEPGTQPLMSCTDGMDRFISLDPACAGKTVLTSIGRIWTEAPPGQSSRLLYQCTLRYGPNIGERFISVSDCEGHTLVGPLGYVLTAVPGPTPTPA